MSNRGLFGTEPSNSLQSQGKTHSVGLFVNSPAQSSNPQQSMFNPGTNSLGSLGLKVSPDKQKPGLFNQAQNAASPQPGLFRTSNVDSSQSGNLSLSSSQVENVPDHLRAKMQQERQSKKQISSISIFNNFSGNSTLQANQSQVQTNVFQALASGINQPSPPKKQQIPQGFGLFPQAVQNTTSTLAGSNQKTSGMLGLFPSQDRKPVEQTSQNQPPKPSSQPNFFGQSTQPIKNESVIFQAKPLSSQDNLFGPKSQALGGPKPSGLFGAQPATQPQNPSEGQGGLFGASRSSVSRAPVNTQARQEPSKSLINKQFEQLFDGVSYDTFQKILRQKADLTLRELSE